MPQGASALVERPAPADAGKYLIFALGGEEFALEIATAREVVPMPPITPVPGTAPFVRGVFNCRGTVTPAIDLRLALGLAAEQSDDTCVILARSGDLEVGLIVDRVTSVIDVGPDQVEGLRPAYTRPRRGAVPSSHPRAQREPAARSAAGQTATALIRGIRRDRGDVTIVLDIGRVMPPGAARALSCGA